jgi:hypothetical protein
VVQVQLRDRHGRPIGEVAEVARTSSAVVARLRGGRRRRASRVWCEAGGALVGIAFGNIQTRVIYVLATDLEMVPEGLTQPKRSSW